MSDIVKSLPADVVLHDGDSFSVDISKPPYAVLCPICKASALAPCRDKPREPCAAYPWSRFPPDAKVIREAHHERQQLYDRAPHMRVQIIPDKKEP